MPGAEIASWERRIFFLDLEVFFFGTAIYFLLAIKQMISFAINTTVGVLPDSLKIRT
jgi:hypothetical protein